MEDDETLFGYPNPNANFGPQFTPDDDPAPADSSADSNSYPLGPPFSNGMSSTGTTVAAAAAAAATAAAAAMVRQDQPSFPGPGGMGGGVSVVCT